MQTTDRKAPQANREQSPGSSCCEVTVLPSHPAYSIQDHYLFPLIIIFLLLCLVKCQVFSSKADETTWKQICLQKLQKVVCKWPRHLLHRDRSCHDIQSSIWGGCESWLEKSLSCHKLLGNRTCSSSCESGGLSSEKENYLCGLRATLAKQEAVRGSHSVQHRVEVTLKILTRHSRMCVFESYAIKMQQRRIMYSNRS